MKLSGRLRRGGCVIALLMAVLLVAPIIDCAPLGNDAHPQATSAAGHFLSSAVEGHDHGVVDGYIHDCGPHLFLGIVKSVLPSRAENVLAPLLLMLVLAVALVATAAFQSAIGGIRSPPVASLPAVDGRAILTKFCIARR
jgi:hypothetical protein